MSSLRWNIHIYIYIYNAVVIRRRKNSSMKMILFLLDAYAYEMSCVSFLHMAVTWSLFRLPLYGRITIFRSRSPFVFVFYLFVCFEVCRLFIGI